MRSASAVLVACCLVLGGCGISSERHPRAVATIAVEETVPPYSGGVHALGVTVFLVDGKQLVPVRRALEPPVGAVALIEAVADGPTALEQTRGLRTALSSRPEITSATVDRAGHLRVDLARDPAEAGAAEQVLAFGQVVLSLTALPSIRSVVFRVAGQPLPVPRGDGSLTTSPLTSRDYTQLRPAVTPAP